MRDILKLYNKSKLFSTKKETMADSPKYGKHLKMTRLETALSTLWG